MPPNLRKSQPNLSKPSEGGSFNAERKPSEGTSPLKGLNLTGERELGSVGGIKATGRVTVGVGDLIGQQGVNVEIDATNRTAGFGAGIGSTKGKLGVNIGGKIGYDEEGRVSIKGAEASINIGGFGGGASIDEDEGIKGSISVAGAKVEVGIAPDGKKTLSLCYGVPGGELCVTFEPDPNSPPTPDPNPTPTPAPAPAPAPTPTPTPTPTSEADIEGGIDLPGSNEVGWVICNMLEHYYNWGNANQLYKNMTTRSVSDIEKKNRSADKLPFKLVSKNNPHPYNADYTYEKGTPVHYFNTYHTKGVVGVGRVLSAQMYPPNTYPFWYDAGFFGPVGEIKKFINLVKANNQADIAAHIKAGFRAGAKSYYYFIPIQFIPLNSKSQESPTLPNYPQHYKPMNCCDKIEEIYQYLGIAKFKKHKFPVSNAFLAPGGTGNNNCVDYYSIMQALFRMLANGLILNPKCKPLGSEYQNVNATAWAADMYEMAAESMSDGNSSQRFEVAAIMQLVQIMGTLAENGRKIEFVADAIGVEPQPVPEEVPVCFTIYEGHKGFGKKEPKKINVSNLKTDKNVEDALGKMLSPSRIPITAWKFKPGQISIKEALRNG